MFARLRGWFEAWKKKLFDAYDPPKPTVYKLGKKKFVKVKRIRDCSDQEYSGMWIHPNSN